MFFSLCWVLCAEVRSERWIWFHTTRWSAHVWITGRSHCSSTKTWRKLRRTSCQGEILWLTARWSMLVRKAINGAGRYRSLRKGFKLLRGDKRCVDYTYNWLHVPYHHISPYITLGIHWISWVKWCGPWVTISECRVFGGSTMGQARLKNLIQESQEMSLLDGILYIATMTSVRRRWSLVLKLWGGLRRRKLKVDTDAGASFFLHVAVQSRKKLVTLLVLIQLVTSEHQVNSCKIYGLWWRC